MTASVIEETLGAVTRVVVGGIGIKIVLLSIATGVRRLLNRLWRRPRSQTWNAVMVVAEWSVTAVGARLIFDVVLAGGRVVCNQRIAVGLWHARLVHFLAVRIRIHRCTHLSIRAPFD
jgi:hypothetical protein